MKKAIIILSTAIFFLSTVSAQHFRVGLSGGVIFSNYKAEVGGNDESGTPKIGLTAGLIANIPAGKNLIVQTGGHWIQKGTEDEEAFEKISLTVNTIEIPINFVYSSNRGFFIGAGPTASFAVSGKWKYNDVSIKTKIGNSADDDMKGFDFGANVLAGYLSATGFLVAANYNQGLINLVPEAAENDKLKSHYFSIRIGYLLKEKK